MHNPTVKANSGRLMTADKEWCSTLKGKLHENRSNQDKVIRGRSRTLSDPVCLQVVSYFYDELFGFPKSMQCRRVVPHWFEGVRWAE